MDCSICLCSLGNGRPLTSVSCGHVFHDSCVETWFNTREDTRGECPVCRTPRVTRLKLFVEFLPTGGEAIAEQLEEANLELDNLKRLSQNKEREVARLQAKVDAFDEREGMKDLEHQLLTADLQHDLRYSEIHLMHARAELGELRREGEKLREAARDAEKLKLQKERLSRRHDKLKTQQTNFRKAVQTYAEKIKTNDWGRNKVCVRNFDASVQENPRRLITSLFVRFSILIVPEEFEVVGCFELVTKPGIFQVILQFTNISAKIELLSKATQLAQHENAAVNRIELVDAAEKGALYRRANAKLRCKGGVAISRLVNGKILVKIKPNDEYIEIVNDEQIEVIMEQAKARGSKPKTKRRKKKARVNPLK